MNQLELDFDYTPEKKASAIICMLENLPKKKWYTYIGIINHSKPHDSVEAIIERSMKKSGIQNTVEIDKLKEKLDCGSDFVEQIIEYETKNVSEPIEDEGVIMNIYRKIVNAKIEAAENDFSDLEDVKNVLGNSLPVDEETSEKLREAWYARAQSD